jgi:uncharacterized OB-fold protein
VPTSLSAPFWEAAKERRLVIRRCLKCGHYHHPPNGQCPHCLSLDLSWQQVSGRGRVYEFTVMYEARVSGFEQAIPYACIVVELDEEPGVFLVANLIDSPISAIRVGLPVRVDFEELPDGTVLPQFRTA